MPASREAASAVRLHPDDNVATALVALAAGQRVEAGVAVTLAAPIPRGHKFALRRIEQGQPVVKYGHPIGRAAATIEPGQHVHVHNCLSQRAGGGPQEP
ncbi:MAG: UxaA family hydrolase [Candidatus Brocadiia bacterium]